MKDFHLFIYNFEFPKGGFKDYAGSFKNAKKAHQSANAILEKKAKEWKCHISEVEANYHIFNSKKREIIQPHGIKSSIDKLQNIVTDL